MITRHPEEGTREAVACQDKRPYSSPPSWFFLRLMNGPGDLMQCNFKDH